MKVIYIGESWEDGLAPDIEVKDIYDVPEEKLKSLLIEVISTFQCRKQLDVAKAAIKDRLGLISPEESATIGTLKPKSNSLIYRLGGTLGYSALKSLNLNGKIPDNKLMDLIHPEVTYFVAVELPSDLQNQVNSYKKKQDVVSRKKEEKKKLQAIAKAKKLLEKHGIVSKI